MADEDDNIDNEDEEDDPEKKRPELIDPDTLPNGNKTVIVGDWSEVKTISEGLQRCTEGDILHCCSGDYDEQLLLNINNIDIMGPPDMSCCVKQGIISTALFSSISKMSIHNAVEVKCGNLSLMECDIAFAKKGIRVHQLANPHVTDCTIHDIESVHIYVHPGGHGIFERCTLTGQGARDSIGISIDNSGSTVFKNNTVSNTMIGAYTCNGCKDVQITENVFKDISAHAIYIDRQSKPTIKENEVLSAEHYGILVSGESCGVLSNNIVHASIRIHEGSRPSFFDNIIVSPGRIINDVAVFALRGIVVKTREELPKKKKPAEPPLPDE
jgi:parallel beta-helix repeat protein